MAGRLSGALEFFGLRHPERQAQQFGDEIPFARYVARTLPLVRGNVLALPIVRRCVGEIVNLVLSAKPVLHLADGSTTDRLPGWLRNPNGLFNLDETISQMVWSSVFNGELFLTWNIGSDGRPRDVWVPRPEDVSFYSSGAGISYADWWTADEQRTAQWFSHRRTLAAPGVWRGVEVLATGKQLTDSAQHTQTALDSHLLADVLTSTVYAFAGKLTAEKRRAFLMQLAKRQQGPRNAGRPIVTDSDLTVHRLQPSMADQKLLELMRDLDARIAANVFFLDPVSLGLGSPQYRGLTYQNLGQARAQNWQRAAAHHARTVASALSDLAGQRVTFDPTEPLRGSPADRTQLAQSMALINAHQTKAGLPPAFTAKEIRDCVGLTGEPPEAPGASVPMLEQQLQLDAPPASNGHSEISLRELEGMLR